MKILNIHNGYCLNIYLHKYNFNIILGHVYLDSFDLEEDFFKNIIYIETLETRKCSNVLNVKHIEVCDMIINYSKFKHVNLPKKIHVLSILKSNIKNIEDLIYPESISNVTIKECGLKHFNKSKTLKNVGNLNLHLNELETLKDFPLIGENIILNNNRLTSLEGIQEIVNADLELYLNFVTDFKNGPKIVKGKLYAAFNEITSLENFPIVKKSITLNGNRLTSLKGIDVNHDADLNVIDNKLTSLEFCPLNVQDLSVRDNMITSLKHLPESCINLEISNNKLSSLKYLTKNVKDINAYNNQITRFEDLEDLDYSLKNLGINENCLTSLKNVPKNIEVLKIYDNEKLTSLEGVERLNKLKSLNCNLTSIDSLMFLPNIDIAKIHCSDTFLTSLENNAKSIDYLIALRNKNLKSLYSYNSNCRSVKTGKVLENKFIKSEYYKNVEISSEEDYYKHLFNFAIKENVVIDFDDNEINWPENFLNENLKKSYTKSNKFNL